MAGFLAIRRAPRAAGAGPMMAAPVGERRAWAAERAAAPSERASRLQDAGFDLVTAAEAAPDREHGAQRLAHVGAYLVETPDPARARAARAVLEADHVIVPNVALELPQTADEAVRARRPRSHPYWPDPSGVGAARDAGLDGAGVVVGVLDTGVDADHLELRDERIEYRYVPLRPSVDPPRAVRGFDVDGHGTHVCGIVAGKNVGVAPGAELLVASVIESESHRTSLERLVVALDWFLAALSDPARADRPAVLNLSLGFRPEWLDDAALRAVTDGTRRLLTTLLVDFEVLPIVAAGNDGPGRLRFPATLPEPFVVGAVDGAGVPAAFSGGGVAPDTGRPAPDAAGYGVDVLSSLERDVDRNSRYANKSGTSMAAPYVAGIAALYAQADPTLQGERLRRKLLDTAAPLGAPADRVGVGLVRWRPDGP